MELNLWIRQVLPSGMSGGSPRQFDRSRRRNEAPRGLGPPPPRQLVGPGPCGFLSSGREKALNPPGSVKMVGSRFHELERLECLHQVIPLCGVPCRVSDLKVADPCLVSTGRRSEER